VSPESQSPNGATAPWSRWRSAGWLGAGLRDWWVRGGRRFRQVGGVGWVLGGGADAARGSGADGVQPDEPAGYSLPVADTTIGSLGLGGASRDRLAPSGERKLVSCEERPLRGGCRASRWRFVTDDGVTWG
jgi:hypothetical protein